MTTVARTRTGVIDLATTTLATHDHACAFGRGRADYTRTLVQVVRNADASDLVIAMGDVDDADPDHDVLTAAVAAGRLRVMDPATAYATLDTGDPAEAMRAARDAFDLVVADAVAEGYRTVRVVADNTTRLAGVSATDRQRWWDWEAVADAWETTCAVTGICWFDTDQLRPADVDDVVRRHALSHGADVPWRVFHRPDADAGVHLALAGAVDVFDAVALRSLIDGVDAATEAAGAHHIDLADVTYLHHRAVDVLAGRRDDDDDPGVRFVNTPPRVRRLLEADGGRLRLVVS